MTIATATTTTTAEAEGGISNVLVYFTITITKR